MRIGLSDQKLLDAVIGWSGAAANTRARLLEAFCSGIRSRSILSNSVTALIVAVFIIADTRNPLHVIWLLCALLGGLMPRYYAARLRRAGEFDRDPERKALTFIAISAVYGSIWGIGPFVLLPHISGTSVGLLLFIIVFGTIMGPYAAMPGILYARLLTTGLPTVIAIALYTDAELTTVAVVLCIWLVLRTDAWRGYHRALRNQIELRERLEQQRVELQAANQAKQRANETLRVIAETDPLTGTANRRQFLRYLESIEGPASLLLFDIDLFKSINDNHGHNAGDEVLRQLSTLVQDALRKEDLLARLGGDEFAIILPGVDEQGARNIAERIRQNVARHMVHYGSQIIQATVSLGVAGSSERNLSLDGAALLRRADVALYAAKHQGRNCSQVSASTPQADALGARPTP